MVWRGRMPHITIQSKTRVLTASHTAAGSRVFVERHLRDDDLVAVNRQPSLHKMSIMAHRAKVMRLSKYLSVRRKTAELENNTGSLVRRWPVLGRINELRCRAYGS